GGGAGGGARRGGRRAAGAGGGGAPRRRGGGGGVGGGGGPGGAPPRSNRAERVGCDETGPEQLPEGGERRRGVEPGHLGEVLGERRAAKLQMQQHVLHARVQLGARRRRRAQPAGVLAQRQADAARARGGRLARLEHRPHDFAREAE